MILYKYYNSEVGLKAIKERMVAFSNPNFFNDPFELTTMLNCHGSPEDELLHNFRNSNIRNSIGILSLTRSPLNPLMWAHYGVNHTGIVVGYDISEGSEFFNSSERCIITAQEGSVIYTTTKPSFELNERNNILVKKVREATFLRDIELNSDVKNLLRTFFLMKHSVWSYEEEVRVVKIFGDIPRKPSISYYAQHELDVAYDILKKKLPDNSEVKTHCIYKHLIPIKEIYIGARSDMGLIKKINDCSSDIDVFKVSVDNKSWNLTAEVVGERSSQS